MHADDPVQPEIPVETFFQADIRIGTVTRAEPFPEARKPAIKLWVDFGPAGTRKSSAQIARHYTPESLVGRQVLAVLNFAPRQIGPFRSEMLTLGVSDADGHIVLLSADQAVPNGTRVS